MISQIFIKYLAYLLHHANRCAWGPSERFYAIKDRILTRWGTLDGFDVQFIPGKKCYSCGGTGHHPKYSNMPPYQVYDYADCYHCSGGWYKRPRYVVLQRYTFGKYGFHKPLESYYKWLDIPLHVIWNRRSNISGRIEHNHSENQQWCTNVLFILFDFRRTVSIYFMFIGRGPHYYNRWNTLTRFIHNLVGLFRSKHIRKAALQSLKYRIFYIKKPFIIKGKESYDPYDDDLPF